MFNKFDRILIFISSYLPLYIWLIISSIIFHNEDNVQTTISLSAPFITNVILSLLVILSIIPLIKISRASGSETFILESSVKFKPMSDSFMNYIVTYFTPLISFDNKNIENILMNLGIFILIGFMYIGSNATYLNPVLGVFGFKLYEVENLNHSHHIITKMKYDDLTSCAQNQEVILLKYKIADGIHLLKKIKSDQ